MKRLDQFVNEPDTDFSESSTREAFQAALDAVADQLGQTVPLVVAGQEVISEQTVDRENPSAMREKIAVISLASEAHAQTALTSAHAAFEAWRSKSFAERADILDKAAALFRQQRFNLAAWEVLEAGKTWVEADADVQEAIDFLLYYAQCARALDGEEPLSHVPGEENLYFREPLGPGVVIAPWNFPIAILMGMASAALVTGNPVLLKPAEQTSMCAYQAVQLLYQAGVPKEVLQFLPGLGEEIGDTLVRSPQIHWIAFTGSREVGLQIIRLAAEVPEGQAHIKRVVAEMGGKNTTIIDADADLDEAVKGVAMAAFGFQGQKCSACSRVSVVKSAYPKFIERLVQTAASLPMGPACAPGTWVGPVVDAQAKAKITDFIERAKAEATVAFEGEVPSELEGHYVAPTIFTEVDPDSALAQEEIFGPVLAVFQVNSFDEALAQAQSVPFALTGGVYSRSPVNVQKAKEAFRVGNLYINRKITGAIVARQPFGGLKLSGTGYKAGGPDYLLQFLQARTQTENVMRHGFAPLEDEPA